MSEPREYGWPAMRELLVIAAIAVVMAAAYAGSQAAGLLLLSGIAGGLVFSIIGTFVLITKVRHREGRGEVIAGAILIIGSIGVFFGLAVVIGGTPRIGGIIMAGGGVLCILGYFLGDVWRC